MTTNSEAFGQIRSLVQGASNNGKVLRQIATIMAKQGGDTEELNEVVKPYVMRGLKGVFAGFMGWEDVKTCAAQNIRLDDKPSDRAQAVLWWMLHMHQGLKASRSGLRASRFYIGENEDHVYDFLIEQSELDFGGAIVEIVPSQILGVSILNNIMARITNASRIELEIESYFTGPQRSVFQACTLASKTTLPIQIKLSTFFTSPHSAAELVSTSVKPSNLTSLVLALENNRNGEPNKGSISNGSGFTKYKSISGLGEKIITFT